ncbi:MAG: transposase [SAR324 cluster bacterium]|nr:transposase [SAR324 cluster bacterium]
MFRKSGFSQQEDFFGGFNFNFSSRKGTALSDPDRWWNQFYKYVTCKMDESLFAPLFSEGMGRPNAPIRVLIAMMILKEGFGWSDSRLFEECNFNILVMKALGVSSLNESIPSESTYYQFKQLLYRYQVKVGVDLIVQCFQELTEAQAKLFGVSLDQIRMDSKLIGSNIADCCRLRLIVSCVLVFWNSLSKSAQARLNQEKRKFLEQLIKKEPQQLVYRLSSEEKKQLLADLGGLISELITLYSSSDSRKIILIERIFKEQYVIDEDKVTLKKGEDIDANSLQSPYDPDAAYRTKRDESVKGYSVNVTETCNAEGLNLITDVQVEPATKSDNTFVQSAIENTEAVVGKVNEVSMDGAYNDESNAKYAKENGKTLLITGIQGVKGRYAFLVLEDRRVVVIDGKEAAVYVAEEYKEEKFRFKANDGTTRYFTQKEIDSYSRRLQVTQMPNEIKNRRNNVEATLFQIAYFTRNNKTRYREKIKHQFWATCRAMWNNLVRIANHLGEVCPIAV